MSLDAEKVHALNAKGFNDLYSKHHGLWEESLENAATYAKTYLKKDGEKVRPGDVSAVLQNSVRVNSEFEKHLERKRLTQKYWAEYFSDYIVEQIFGTPEI